MSEKTDSDFVDAVNKFRSEPATKDNWQPIETAPKDGSLILLGKIESADDDMGAVSTAGRWQDMNSDAPDDMGCDAGFIDVDYQQFRPSRSFGAAAYRYAGDQPTHWMPLPEPPTINPENKE